MADAPRIPRLLAIVAIALVTACTTAAPPTLDPAAPTGAATSSGGPTVPGEPTATDPTGSEPPAGETPGTSTPTVEPGTIEPTQEPGTSEPTDDPATSGPTSEPSLEATPSPTEAPSPPDAGEVDLDIEQVLDGLTRPSGVFHAGDERIFIVEQEGRIKVARPRDGRYELIGTFLDQSERVACCGERGLLGLAFHPRYAENGLFYISYATESHYFELEERRVSADDPDRADRRYRRTLLHIYKPHDYHWGGGIHFGRDGYLWLAMGDGGFMRDVDGIGDPDNDSQKLDSLFGKLIRIDVNDPDGDGEAAYGIPPDNPYVDSPEALPEIWARGLRNPWRWSFDRWTGDLWLTDTGHSTWEEVNRAKAPGLGAEQNYGWRLMEGPSCYIPARGCDPNGKTARPLAAYRHNFGSSDFQCAITGGMVYRGVAYPAMQSRFFFGDYCSGRIFSVKANGRDRQEPLLELDTGHAWSGMGDDLAGELYVTDIEDGTVFRLVGEPG